MIRRFLGFVFTASLLCLASRSGFATTAPALRIIDNGPSISRAPSDPLPMSATCTFEPGPLGTFSVVYNTPDYWKAVATRVQIGACTACAATSALTLTDVSFRVRWLSAGTAQATVSVIAGVVSGSCLVPDESQVLCPPVTYTISSVAAGGVIYTLPFSSGCCLTKDAFVLVQYSGLFDPNLSTSHGLTLATGPCVACDQYIESVSMYPTLTDVCSTTVAAPYWFSIGANCCTPTSTIHQSWGDLKIMYR